MGKASLVFYKFDCLWVVPAQGRTPDGLTVHIEPVALIPEEDVVELSRAIVERLHLKSPSPEGEGFHAPRRLKPTDAART